MARFFPKCVCVFILISPRLSGDFMQCVFFPGHMGIIPSLSVCHSFVFKGIWGGGDFLRYVKMFFLV